MKKLILEHYMFIVSGISAIALTILLVVDKDLLHDFLNYMVYFLMFGIITPIGIVVYERLKKHYGKSSSAKIMQESQSNFIPFRDKESKDNYHNHLVRDICQVLENQVNLDNQYHVISLLNLPVEKRNVILSHFYSSEGDSKKYLSLYTTYRKLLEFERITNRKARKVYDHLEEMDSYLLNLHFNNASETEYNMDDLSLSLKITNKTDLINFKKMQTTFKKIMFPNQIYNVKKGEKYVIEVNHKEVFKTISYDIAEKCKEMLRKKLEIYHDLVSEAWYSTNLEMFARLDDYDTTLKNNFEFIKNGEPIIGSCSGCMQHFIGSQKSKFEKLLIEFEKEKVELSKI